MHYKFRRLIVLFHGDVVDEMISFRFLPAGASQVSMQSVSVRSVCILSMVMIQIKKQKNPILVACDVYRPAAIDQLNLLGEQIGVEVYLSLIHI